MKPSIHSRRSTRVTVATMTVVLLLTVSARAQDNTASMLTLESAEYDPVTQRFSVTLRNQGHQVATAWRYAILVGDQRVMEITRDYYQGTAFDDLRTAQSSVVLPRAERQDTVPFSTAADPTDVRLTVVAAIFDDKSAEGESRAVDEIFSTRQLHVRELRDILKELRAARGAPDSRLRAFFGDLSRASTPRLSSPRASVRADLARLLAGPPDADLQASLDQLISVYDRLLTAAQRHAR